ncbi:MAG: NAD(P)H-hydrate dehydratase [Acidimicrobiia bacterium]
MRPVLSVAEMRSVDAAASLDVDRLMDRAGFAVAFAAHDLGAGYGARVDVLCGKGNNGGDGYVAATHLARRGAAVTVHAFGEPAEGTPVHRARERALRSGVAVGSQATPPRTDVVIDAVVGTGFQGDLQPELAPWAGFDAPVVAVDIPSGLDGDSGSASGVVFSADITVTFHSLKPGHLLGRGPDLCGEVRVVDIGLSGGKPTMVHMEDHDVVVPYRPRTAHKWSAGAVATMGGMPGLTGAALLTARSALAAGAGVSNLIATPATATTYATQAPDIPILVIDEVTTPSDAATLLERLGRFDALVVGPGLEPASRSFVEALVATFDGPLILDAGALNALEDPEPIRQRDGATILTPHAGEFQRLAGEPPSVESVRRLADTTGAIVVAKGSPTLVAHGRVIVDDAGGPELATIGSGDVLAGMIAAFAATSRNLESAVVSAVHLHGVAGSIARDLGTVTATELLAAVGPTVGAFTTA